MIFLRMNKPGITAYLSLGSNMDDRESILLNAMGKISRRAGTIIARSHWYEAEPWGFQSENKFINLCLACKTDYRPEAFLSLCLAIEAEYGRIRAGSYYTDRPLDIDIIFWGNEVIHNETLMIPHPRFSARKFVLLPLNDIAPDLIDPVSGKSVKQLLEDCPDKTEVKPL